jgi:phospholipase/carboxylesterase
VAVCTLVVACKRAPEPAITTVASSSSTTTASAPLRPCTPPHVEIVPPPAASTDTTIVFLHGYGSNAADIAPVARALANATKAAAIVPDGCDPWDGGGESGRQWMPYSGNTPPEKAASDMREGATRLQAWLATEMKTRGLPTKRVVFAGFSQGAMLSLHLATHHAPPPVAIVSFSGKLVVVDEAPAPPGLPVLVIHGARDPIVPFTAAAEAERLLVARGAKVSRLDRPEMAHSIDDESVTAAIAFLRETLAVPP